MAIDRCDDTEPHGPHRTQYGPFGVKDCEGIAEPAEPKSITRFEFTVLGRPAPQGSKKKGNAGQLREASAYLPAWRAAIKRAAYERYVELGVEPGDLPLITGAVAFGCTFWMPPDRRVDAPPDLDKLLRAVWDSLTAARVWEDDGRVIEIDHLNKTLATSATTTGAAITVRALGCQECADTGVCPTCHDQGWTDPGCCVTCGGSGRCECCPKKDEATPTLYATADDAYADVIRIAPVESARDGWHQAECTDCDWQSWGGLESVVEESGWEHVTEKHVEGST